MTPDQAQAYNAAIEHASKSYKNGIGAILALKIKSVVTVEHVGRSTKQEVVDVADQG